MDKPLKLSVKDQKEMDTLTKQLTDIFADLNRERCPSCEICCCGSCGSSWGYLENYGKERPPVAFLKKEYGFTKKSGFLSKTGCKLPREFRSSTCLKFNCKWFRERSFSEATVTGSITILGETRELSSEDCMTIKGYALDNRLRILVREIEKLRGW